MGGPLGCELGRSGINYAEFLVTVSYNSRCLKWIDLKLKIQYKPAERRSGHPLAFGSDSVELEDGVWVASIIAQHKLFRVRVDRQVLLR